MISRTLAYCMHAYIHTYKHTYIYSKSHLLKRSYLRNCPRTSEILIENFFRPQFPLENLVLVQNQKHATTTWQHYFVNSVFSSVRCTRSKTIRYPHWIHHQSKFIYMRKVYACKAFRHWIHETTFFCLIVSSYLSAEPVSAEQFLFPVTVKWVNPSLTRTEKHERERKIVGWIHLMTWRSRKIILRAEIQTILRGASLFLDSFPPFW